MILWLASYPKSGNTWLRCLYAAYQFGGVSLKRIQGSVGDVNPYIYHKLSPYPNPSHKDQSLLRQAALLNEVHLADEKPVLVKTHFVNAQIDENYTIPKTMTQGAMVIVRDPRDIALSFSRHLGKSVDDTIAAMNQYDFSIVNKAGISSLLSTWSNNVATWVNEKRFPVEVMRYEDMQLHPARALRLLLGLKGVDDPDDDRIDHAVRVCGFKALQEKEAREGFAEASDHNDRFFNSGKCKQWLDGLTREQIEQIESDHGVVMKMMGYSFMCEAVA